MSDKSINLKDRHAWPVAAAILLIFITPFNAELGFILSAVALTGALIYYYVAKAKSRRGR